MRIYTFVCRYIGFFDKGYNIRIYIGVSGDLQSNAVTE